MNAFDEPLRLGFHPRSFLNEKSLFFVKVKPGRIHGYQSRVRVGRGSDKKKG